jgi:hypothetical protein
MKTCKQCLVSKPITDFYALPHTKDGRNFRCVPCQNQYNRDHARKRALEKINPELISAFKDIPYEYQARFLRRVEALDSGCWLWTGCRHPKSGYGRFWLSRHTDRLAHRLAYVWSGNVIPDTLVIDHLCRNRACVNPDHMEPVTNVENVMRGESLWALNAKKTHCLRGHEFTVENTWISKHNMRHCRECARLRKRESRALRMQPYTVQADPPDH